jgi:predicted nucleic acid-binding protein
VTTSMIGKAFLDTNVLVYAFDAGAGAKQERGQRILDEAAPGELVVSAQVLNEFYVTVTRKLATPLDGDAARSAVRELTALEVIPVTGALVLAGIDRAARSQLSLWDALIVEAAHLRVHDTADRGPERRPAVRRCARPGPLRVPRWMSGEVRPLSFDPYAPPRRSPSRSAASRSIAGRTWA